MIKQHYLHVYDKARQAGYTGTAASTDTVPLLGNWIRTYEAEAYKHRLVAKGGFDSASCAVRVLPAEAEYAFTNLVGNTAHIYVDNPAEPIFEGYISRITYRVGSIALTRSVDEMANTVRVTYYDANSTATVKTEVNSAVNNALSVAQYGPKAQNFDANIHYNNADKTHKTALRSVLLGIRSWPMVSVTTGDFDAGLLEIELRGLHYMAWEWAIYESTATGTNTPNALLERLSVRAVGNEPPLSYYLFETSPSTPSSASRLINTNSAWTISRESRSGQTYMQFIESLVEAGDGLDKWVYGLTPWGEHGPTRLVYYRKADKTVKYQAFALRETGILRDVYGSVVDGWRVKPDGAVRLMDALIGYDAAGDDPRISYLDAIEYDGDTGAVTWQTADNMTMEGVLQKDRYFRAHGKPRFGAPVRTVL